MVIVRKAIDETHILWYFMDKILNFDENTRICEIEIDNTRHRITMIDNFAASNFNTLSESFSTMGTTKNQ